MSHSGLNCYSVARPMKAGGRSVCADKELAPGEKKPEAEGSSSYLHTKKFKIHPLHELRILPEDKVNC